MQSAPQFSATLTNTSFGRPSSITELTLNPASLSWETAPSTAALTLTFSSLNQEMIAPDASGGVRFGTVHEALTTRASLPFGHSRVAAERTAFSAPLDPSTPTISRTGAPGSLTRPRLTRTEQCASCDNFCETLPKKNRPNAVRPCDPTTSRSGFQSSAFSMITVAGEPTLTSASTSQVDRMERNRATARDASAIYSSSRSICSTTSSSDGGGSQCSTTDRTLNCVSPGNPAFHKSSSAASAHSEPSYATITFICFVILLPLKK